LGGYRPKIAKAFTLCFKLKNNIHTIELFQPLRHCHLLVHNQNNNLFLWIDIFIDRLMTTRPCIPLSIKVYNPADVPDGEGPAMRRMTPGGGMDHGPCIHGCMA
jgi:hypothetical protein